MGVPTVSKYDIYLGDKASINGYRTRQLVRDSAPLIAARFSTGAQGQTDLDLLKSVSVDDFSGGMFKRDWVDPTRAARVLGVYNSFNSMLYPTYRPTAYTSSQLNTGIPSAKVETDGVSYIAFGMFVTGTGAGTGYISKLYKADVNGGMVAITLPTIYTTNGTCSITSLEIHSGYLYIAAQSYGTSTVCHRMKLSDNTFQNIGGVGSRFFELRGVLYLIQNSSEIWTCTNEFAAGAATYTKIDVCGQNEFNNTPNAVVEFNGAVWISKPEGLFRFDGIKSTKVLRLATRSLCEYNGALYFVSGRWIYKFDGTNVTKLQFTGETFDDLSFTSSPDYLYFVTRVDSGTFQSMPDKSGNTGATVRRIYSYDGVAFTLLSEVEMTGLWKRPFVALFNSSLGICEMFCLAASTSNTAPYSIYYNVYVPANAFDPTYITAASKLDITTSEFDAGFPNVYKSANVFELSYSGMITGDSFAVSYSIFDGKAWGAWNSLGTITPTSDNKIEIVDDTKMLFKRIKFSVVATLASGSTLALKGVSLRWTLQPRLRWRWQASLIAYGTSIIDRLGAATTQSANTLNNLITKSIKQKTPIYMLTSDYTVVKTTANSAATSIVLQGELPTYTDPYLEYPLIAIKNASDIWEILRVTGVTYSAGTDQTTITIAERGYLGITAAELTSGKEVHLCHRVYVTRLIRDSVELNEDTYDEQSTKATQVKREFTIELTEV